VTSDPAEALDGAEVVIVAVPSTAMRANASSIAGALADSTVVVSAAKGLEPETNKRMSQVLADELPAARVAALSGPNLAREVVQGLPASSVVASEDEQASFLAQAVLNSPTLRIYTNTDLIGTEFAGALKNIIAIGAGVCHGMGLGDNAKSAFVTRGLVEITRLGVAAGAQAQTFAGLAGIGDLVATCFSRLSRNHRVGVALATGLSPTEALATLGGEVAEGVCTTPVALALAASLGVEMPIASLTNRVLFDELSPRDAIGELMGRAPRPE
jgi:glycerol-3-phosphate dehydrogenase (NAD(P)+)